MENKEIAKEYFRLYTSREMEKAINLLSPNLIFQTPSEVITSVDEFMSKCWQHGDGLKKVEFLKIVGEDDKIFFVMHWKGQNTSFFSVEYVEITNGKISKMIVLNPLLKLTDYSFVS